MSESLLVSIGIGVLNVITIPLLIYVFRGLLTKMDKLDDNLTKLSDKIENISTRLTVVESKISNLNIIYDRVDDLSQRLTVIETKCSTQHSKSSKK